MDKVKDGCLQPTQNITNQNKTNMETSNIKFSASSFAEVLIEVGNQINSAKNQVEFANMQRDSIENELKRSKEYSRKCDSFIRGLQESADKDKSELIALRLEVDKLKAKVSKASKVAKSRHKPKGSATKAKIGLNTAILSQEEADGMTGSLEPQNQR